MWKVRLHRCYQAMTGWTPGQDAAAQADHKRTSKPGLGAQLRHRRPLQGDRRRRLSQTPIHAPFTHQTTATLFVLVLQHVAHTSEPVHHCCTNLYARVVGSLAAAEATLCAASRPVLHSRTPAAACALLLLLLPPLLLGTRLSILLLLLQPGLPLLTPPFGSLPLKHCPLMIGWKLVL